MYIPDPAGASGIYARPGMTLLNGGASIFSPGRAEGGYAHIDLSGVVYNFVVIGGHLIRVDQTLATFTDVTPVGVTIDGSDSTRIKFVSLAGIMVVSDGIHRPWVASNLSSTPITGTYIDFDGSGTDWSAQDITVYSGAIVVLLDQFDGAFAKTDIAWSAPGDPTLGYQQPTYDYRWTLEQTGSAPIYAIHGTNIGLYYWRQRSIGLATGALGPDFQTTHTDDAVADNVGSQSPQTVQGFSDRLFFTDQIGRPWMLPLGGAPVAIWQNMRAEIDASLTSYQSVTSIVSTSAFEPTLNIYHVGIWSAAPSGVAPIVQWFAFDAATGNYLGPWYIVDSNGTKYSVELLCTFLDNTSRTTMMIFTSGGKAWSFNALLGTPDLLTTEGGSFLTTEDADRLTTEGQDAVWTDNGVVPGIGITTNRLGYQSDVVWLIDQATVITGSASPVRITSQTPNSANTLEGTPTPSPSQDGTYRCVVGAYEYGRGVEWTVSPTTAEEQWSFQMLSMIGVPSLAGPDDP